MALAEVVVPVVLAEGKVVQAEVAAVEMVVLVVAEMAALAELVA